MSPNRAALESLIASRGIALSSKQYDQIWAYHQMLRSANADLNLTRIHNFENMVLKHYVDSLMVLKFIEPSSRLLDMGSGAGLPGVPIKIARPDLALILAEPRGARARFLTEVCERLGFTNVEVSARRIGREYQPKVAAVISRAVASIPETLDRIGGCLDTGGRAIFMKGPNCDLEVEEAGDAHRATFELESDHTYSIPGTPHERRLLVYKKLEVETRATVLSTELKTAGRIIESTSNPLFKLCREVQKGKGIRKEGRALFSGAKLIAEVIAKFPERVEAWITGPGGPEPPAPAPGHVIEWIQFAKPLFEAIDSIGTHAPLLLVHVPTLVEWNDADPWPIGCTLFVPFQDPENVGAIIRSAAAFGVARVVLTVESANPFHPRATRASGPAVLQVPLRAGPSIHDLRALSAPLIALATDGPELGTEPWPDRFGLVAGLEGPGLPDHLRGGLRRRIPIAPGVESLNAAVAASVALYDWSRQRHPSI